MSYVDSLLAPGETIVRREHQHWFVLVAGARGGVLAVIAAIVLLAIKIVSDQKSTLMDILGWVALVLLVVGLVVILWGWLRYRNELYLLSTRRVIHVGGVLNKETTDSSLEKINDAKLTEPLLGRIFGYGDLEIDTASESGIERLRMLRNAKAFKVAMVDAKHNLELDVARQTTPPLRQGDAPTPT